MCTMGDGQLVSQRRKFGWHVSGERSSQIFSRVDIQDTARWQFCKHTQVPSFMAERIIFTAIGPWPCPREMDLNWEPPMFLSLANFSRPKEKSKQCFNVVFDLNVFNRLNTLILKLILYTPTRGCQTYLILRELIMILICAINTKMSLLSEK